MSMYGGRWSMQKKILLFIVNLILVLLNEATWPLNALPCNAVSHQEAVFCLTSFYSKYVCDAVHITSRLLKIPHLIFS